MVLSDAKVHEYYGTLGQFTDESYKCILIYGILGNAIGIADVFSTDDVQL